MSLTLPCPECRKRLKRLPERDDDDRLALAFACPKCGDRYNVTYGDADEHWHYKYLYNAHKDTAPLWEAMYDELRQQQPMTVRQMFYRMSVRSVVDKSEKGYGRVQYALVNMRKAGAVPYAWITDNTRWMRKPTTFDSLTQAIDFWQRSYRRSLWAEQNAYVEIWCEKDALAGVMVDVTAPYDVPLYVARGYSSVSFLYSAAEYIKAQGKPAYVYHFGDYDPSGKNAAAKVAETMREFGADFEFIEAAITPEQIDRWQLPTRTTKRTDSRSARWLAEGKGDSVELDAIAPNDLRKLVSDCIERHIDQRQLSVTREAERSERALLLEFRTSQKFGGAA